VVIVSYNGRQLLQACLDSLAAEAKSLAVRVIVVDNDSRDGTSTMVRERYPLVDLIPSGGNLGFARAANIGLRLTTSDNLLVLNPDTEVPAGALTSCIAALEARPHVGILGCKLVKADGTLDHACKRGFPTPLSALAYLSGISRRRPRSRALGGYTAAHLSDDDVGFVDAVNGAFMLLRRSALEEVGLLDEAYWMYGEDLDWCYRFWEKGWAVLYWPRVTVLHVKGGITGRHRSLRTNHAFHRSMWLFYRKHYASHRSTILNAAVWTAIWARLILSVMRSSAVRMRAQQQRPS
jgi:N-acetylglucosaminyl-diphospho-decaprenol L-rhamnosyltransferase